MAQRHRAGTAARFLSKQVFVFITGRWQAELDNAVSEISSNVIAIQADSSNLADLDRVYEAIRTTKGWIDIVVANAGILEHAPLAQVTEAHFDQVFSINVKGLVFTVQKALPLMPDGSIIILMSSTVAIAHRGPVGSAVGYSALFSKQIRASGPLGPPAICSSKGLGRSGVYAATKQPFATLREIGSST